MTKDDIAAAVVALAARWEKEANAEQSGAVAGTLRECAGQIRSANGTLTLLADTWEKEARRETFASIADTLIRCARELRSTAQGRSVETVKKKRRYVRKAKA